MKIHKITCFAIIAIGLISCGQNAENKKFISDINSMLRVNDSLKNQLDTINYDHIESISKEMAGMKKDIKTYYHSDEVDEKLARKITRFNGARKQLGKLKNKKTQLFRKMDTLQVQLNRLKQDIENNAGVKEKYQEYIDLERKNFIRVKQEQQALYLDTRNNMLDYEELTPFVRKFIEDIKTID